MRCALEGDWSFPQAQGSAKNGRSRAVAAKGVPTAVSDSAKDLVSSALTVDSAARLRADALLNHAWLRSDAAVSTKALPDSVIAAVHTRAKRRKNLAARYLKTCSSLPEA